MGGALLQSINRDTQRFAWKASAIRRAGIWSDVYKNPKTDPTKASKGGRFKVSNASGHFVTIPIATQDVNNWGGPGDILETVFENGEVVKEYSLKEIRQRVAQYDRF